MNTQYNYPNLKKAVELLDESNYTEGQLVAYDRYLDSIRSWNSSMKLSYEEGMEEGEKKGKEEGRLEGKIETEKIIVAIIKDLKSGIDPDEIASKYQVDLKYVEKLL